MSTKKKPHKAEPKAIAPVVEESPVQGGLKIVYWPIDKFVHYARNPRKNDTPTAADLASHGVHAVSAMRALNVPSMSALMSLAGLAKRKKQPNKHPKYPPPVLLEMLRDFYVMHHRIPACSDHRRGVLPDHRTFVRAFKSRRAALIAAGLPVGVAA